MTTTTNATLRLLPNGPTGTVAVDGDRDDIEAVAREWADAQIGHPYDALTISVDGESWEISQ